MKSLGIDIGTTTITALVTDNDELIEAKTFNNQLLRSSQSFEKIQDPNQIYQSVIAEIDRFISKHEDIETIGVTGQMHGILYVSEDCEPLTPLFLWCDERSGELMNGRETYCDYIEKLTGKKIPVGYGLATHFYNAINKVVDTLGPYKIMTIGDFIANKLAAVKFENMRMHSTNAASLGLYDLKTNRFYREALRVLDINDAAIPSVTVENEILGKYKNASVTVAIGDNQASYFGVANNKDAICVNVGTGSQLSVRIQEYRDIAGIETRPYVDGTYLLVGASICGGMAFEALAKLFQEISRRPLDEVYEFMIQSSYDEDDELIFEPTFSGTREDKNKRGSLHNITLKNFRKDNMVIAMLRGITNELYAFYEKMGLENASDYHLVASGNGIRKNPLLQKIIEKTFKKTLVLSPIIEEAAYGASLFSQIKQGEQR